mmetsp:Transcript_19249/g.43830  ORF Transcript_19249/g.43830 Transcript_19249/m.43830 type:complete len:92 (+) Transcript_19249:162-437(+)
MRSVGNILENGNFVIATKDNCTHPRPGMSFQVNDDGSISPVEAPNLVLGFYDLSALSNDSSIQIKVEGKKKRNMWLHSLNEKVQKIILENT